MAREDNKLVKTAEGLTLLVSRRSSGVGVPILFLNSISADHTMWDAVRDRLNRPSVAFDTRGHGKSDATAGRVTITDLANDAIAVMDAIGMDRAIVCGLSLGGPVAMQIATLVPDRVVGLILANTATHFPTPERWQDRAAKLRNGGLSDMIQPTLERWVTEDWRRANPEGVAQIKDMLLATPPEGYAAACYALETADTSSALAGWTGPALIIAGAYDRSTPPERAEEMKKMCPSASLVTLGTAHISAIEDPDGFANALETFADLVETG